MDEIVALVLQGSPWGIVAIMGLVIYKQDAREHTTHKDYSKEMAKVQEKRREEAVAMSDKFSDRAQGTAQALEKLTSALTGLNGGH